MGTPSIRCRSSFNAPNCWASFCWSIALYCHRLAACRTKVVRLFKGGKHSCQCSRKYCQIPMSVSIPRYSATISIVITSLSLKAGANPLALTFWLTVISLSSSSILQNTAMIKYSIENIILTANGVSPIF